MSGLEEVHMWFWWFMFVCDLIVPIIMIIGGRMMWKHTPKNINSVVGYRTKRSMKNMDTWKFAHVYCGKSWWRIGWILLIVSIVVQIPFYNCSDDIMGTLGGFLCLIQCFILILSIIPTEMALKKNFTVDGIRK